MFASARRRPLQPRKIRTMLDTSPQMRTLCRALEKYGDEAALAKALGVSATSLSGWLAGRDPLPPANVYFKALALVSAGERRRFTAR
jgi:hypothetical protein